MRHRKAGLKLNRTSSHRDAMFRNMVTSLLKHERIQTTDIKAKELRRWADHVITLAKRGDLHARRQAMAIVREKDVVHKLFAEAAERFGARPGGYTRVVKIGARSGDAAPMSMIELITVEAAEKKPKRKKGKTEAASKKAVPVAAPKTPETPPEAAPAATSAPEGTAAAAPVEAPAADSPDPGQDSVESPENEEEKPQ